MAILTFKNIPQERYGEIVSYAFRNNIKVELWDGTKKYLFSRIRRREFEDSSLRDIEIIVGAPVIEEDRAKANDAVKGLARFIIEIIGQEGNLE